MRACKKCRNVLTFEKNVKYIIMDIEEHFSKNFFYVSVEVNCNACALHKKKNYVFCINPTFLSSIEIKKVIEEKIKKKLRLI